VSEKTDILKNFIAEKIYDFSVMEQDGGFREIPSFEIYPREYLRFAEQELETPNDTRHLINCISHLKRAMECQIDIFLHSFCLLNVFQKRNLGIDKKLELIQETRVATARTLSRLNTIRNRMEHAYEIPKLHDIEVYFDLVTSFVVILERARTFSSLTDLKFELYDDDKGDKKPYGYFSIKYDYEKLNISVQWESENNSNGLVAELKDIQEFGYFFRVFILLSQFETLSTYDDITNEL
jgi:hypothetical protein